MLITATDIVRSSVGTAPDRQPYLLPKNRKLHVSSTSTPLPVKGRGILIGIGSSENLDAQVKVHLEGAEGLAFERGRDLI